MAKPPKASKVKAAKPAKPTPFTPGAFTGISNIQLTTLERIISRSRRRNHWHKAEKTLILQGKAVCRRICDGDKTAGSELYDFVGKLTPEQIEDVLANGHANPRVAEAVEETIPIIKSGVIMNQHRTQVEHELEQLAYTLPVMQWVNDIHGVGPGSLAAIIGNAGNLWNYPTVQKLWKRMGMAVMPDGRRQRNIRGADEETKKAAGYNAQRRSVVWKIGTSIMFAQSAKVKKDKETGEVLEVVKAPGPWRQIYDRRREYEEAKNERGEYAEQAKAILASATFGKTTETYKAYTAGRLPKAHLKARAQRYMEKEFLKRLWIEWRRTMHEVRPPKEGFDSGPEPQNPPAFLVKREKARA